MDEVVNRIAADHSVAPGAWWHQHLALAVPWPPMCACADLALQGQAYVYSTYAGRISHVGVPHDRLYMLLPNTSSLSSCAAARPVLHTPSASHMHPCSGACAGQVLLRWSLQRGYVPITTSSNPDRLSQFLAAAAVPSPAHDTTGGEAQGFTLSDQEVGGGSDG